MAPLPVNLAHQGKEIVARLQSAERNDEKSEQMYKSAGIILKNVKATLHEHKSEEFSGFREFCAKGCAGLQQPRADIIIAIAEGRKTLGDVRAAGAARFRKHAAKIASKAQGDLLDNFKKAVDRAAEFMNADTKRKAKAYVELKF